MSTTYIATLWMPWSSFSCTRGSRLLWTTRRSTVLPIQPWVPT
uniref:Uncharacterized protein n=1 Tax=Anguilla anguilla TaxID=7936 RepID=A0A0E9TVE8_ANGAN